MADTMQSEGESAVSLKKEDKDLVQGDYRKNVMTATYEEITLDQELQNVEQQCDFQHSKEFEKDSQIVSERDKILNLPKAKDSASYSDNNSSFVSQKMSPHIGDQNASVEYVERNGREDSEKEDIEEDVMSGSYGEISLDRELLSSNKNSDSQSSKEDLKFYQFEEKSESVNEIKEKKRPDSLVLTQNVLDVCNEDVKDTSHVQHIHRSQQTSECRTSAEVSPSLSSEEFAYHSGGHARTSSDTSGLSELQGTLTVDGDLVTFVAEDLQEIIKMSSPVSRVTDSSSFPGSRSSTPSLYRQALQPQFHIVDPHIISDLEADAKKVATVVDTMLENLSETLQSFSSLTVACMETYESSVCKTCDAVDANIKAVYQLMAKCEELSNSMQPLYRISGDVKHIKKMLDHLEHIVEHKS